SRLYTAITSRAPIWRGRPARWNLCTRSERQQEETAMETLIEELEKSAGTTQPEQKKSAQRAGKNKTRLLIIGAMAVVVAAGTGAYTHFRDRVSTDDAQVDAHIAPIAPKISGSVA